MNYPFNMQLVSRLDCIWIQANRVAFTHSVILQCPHLDINVYLHKLNIEKKNYFHPYSCLQIQDTLASVLNVSRVRLHLFFHVIKHKSITEHTGFRVGVKKQKEHPVTGWGWWKTHGWWVEKLQTEQHIQQKPEAAVDAGSNNWQKKTWCDGCGFVQELKSF